jgi:hypothetical protein
MPKIVGIHGISHQYEGSAILNSRWLPALHGGLSAAGYRSLAAELTSSDLSVAFFGDLFRPPGAALSAGDIPYTAQDLTVPAEIDLLTDLYDAAVALEPELGPPDGSLGFVGNAGLMVERVLRSRAFANRISPELTSSSSNTMTTAVGSTPSPQERRPQATYWSHQPVRTTGSPSAISTLATSLPG